VPVGSGETIWEVYKLYILYCFIFQEFFSLQRGHYMSSEPNFQHSDPGMKLSICEAKIMNSSGDFFQKFKKVGFFKNSNFKTSFNRKFTKTGL
jgi:hypothetical protein